MDRENSITDDESDHDYESDEEDDKFEDARDEFFDPSAAE